jgi:hypothetical protein
MIVGGKVGGNVGVGVGLPLLLGSPHPNLKFKTMNMVIKRKCCKSIIVTEIPIFFIPASKQKDYYLFFPQNIDDSRSNLKSQHDGF